MKYRVKFNCYWYNTGAADNHHYTNHEDFDTIEQAQEFEKRVKKQFALFNDFKKSTFEEREAWKNSKDYIEIENGFITDSDTAIVKYYPEREESY